MLRTAAATGLSAPRSIRVVRLPARADGTFQRSVLPLPFTVPLELRSAGRMPCAAGLRPCSVQIHDRSEQFHDRSVARRASNISRAISTARLGTP